MTPEMWEERITSSYAQHKGMLRYDNAMACILLLIGGVCVRTVFVWLVITYPSFCFDCRSIISEFLQIYNFLQDFISSFNVIFLMA